MAKKYRRPKMGIEQPSFFDPFTRRDEPPPLAPPPPGALQPPGGPPPAAGVPMPEPAPVPWESMFGKPVPVGRAAAAARPAAPPRPAAPTFVRLKIDPNQIFDTKALFEHVLRLKRSAEWRPPVMLLQVARPTQDPVQTALEVGAFLRIPYDEISRYGANAWQYLVEPRVRHLDEALNQTKPAELPGVFRFDFAPDRSFWLGYTE